MTTRDQKLRIVLAVFDRVSTLGSAIEALLRADIALTCLGLIVLAKTAAVLEAEPPQGDVRLQTLPQLLKDLAALPSAADGGTILVSSNLVKQWLAGWQMPALWASNKANGTAPLLAADLERHVRKGGAILTVTAETTRQQWQCTRILLAQSSASVLALECSMAPEA